jgi:hypothetical protein
MATTEIESARVDGEVDNDNEKTDIQNGNCHYTVIKYRSSLYDHPSYMQLNDACHSSRFKCDIHVPSNPVSHLKIYARHTITYEEYCTHKSNDGLISLDCEFSIHFPPEVSAYILPMIYRKHHSSSCGNVNEDLEKENYLDTTLQHYRSLLQQYPRLYKPLKTRLPRPISYAEFSQYIKDDPQGLKYERIDTLVDHKHNEYETIENDQNPQMNTYGDDMSSYCHTVVVNTPTSTLHCWADEVDEENENENNNNNHVTKTSSSFRQQPKKLDFVSAASCVSSLSKQITSSLDELDGLVYANIPYQQPSKTLESLLKKRVTCRQSKSLNANKLKKYHANPANHEEQNTSRNMHFDLGPYEPFIVTSDFPDAHKVPVFYSGQLLAEVLLVSSSSPLISSASTRQHRHSNKNDRQKTKILFKFQNS